jgi:hypothetical protein
MISFRCIRAEHICTFRVYRTMLKMSLCMKIMSTGHFLVKWRKKLRNFIKKHTVWRYLTLISHSDRDSKKCVNTVLIGKLITSFNLINLMQLKQRKRVFFSFSHSLATFHSHTFHFHILRIIYIKKTHNRQFITLVLVQLINIEIFCISLHTSEKCATVWKFMFIPQNFIYYNRRVTKELSPRNEEIFVFHSRSIKEKSEWERNSIFLFFWWQ